jgi:hypothetical protein
VANQSYFQHKTRSIQLPSRPRQSDIRLTHRVFERADTGEATHNIWSRLDLVAFLVADNEVRKKDGQRKERKLDAGELECARPSHVSQQGGRAGLAEHTAWKEHPRGTR